MEAKKNPNKEIGSKRNLFLCSGLCISLLLMLTAFEFKTANTDPDIIPENWVIPEPEAMDVVPPIKFPEPKPPVAFPKIRPIPDDAEIDEPEPEWTFTPPDDQLYLETVIQMKEETPEEPAFVPVEHMASFPGGMVAWREFLMDNIKYPRMAQRGGIEGKVQLSFYVDAEGNLSDIRVTRGIGAGCDEEAIRVLKKSPKWSPGLQRGRPVKSPMSIFIHFKLK